MELNTVIGQGRACRFSVRLGRAWETPLVGSDGSVTFDIGNPYQSIGQAIARPSRRLYTDRGKPGRGDREAALVLPGRATTSRTTTCGVAHLRCYRRGSMIITGGKVGIRLRAERTGRRAVVKDAGRRAQQARQRLPARAVERSRSVPVTICRRSAASYQHPSHGGRYIATINLPITYTQHHPLGLTGNKAAGPETGRMRHSEPRHRGIDTFSSMPLGATTSPTTSLRHALQQCIRHLRPQARAPIVYSATPQHRRGCRRSPFRRHGAGTSGRPQGRRCSGGNRSWLAAVPGARPATTVIEGDRARRATTTPWSHAGAVLTG